MTSLLHHLSQNTSALSQQLWKWVPYRSYFGGHENAIIFLPFIRTSIHPSVHLFVYFPKPISIHQFLWTSICLPIYLFVCISICQSIYPHLSIYLSTFIYLLVYLSIHLPVNLSTYLHIHPLHTSPSTHLPIHSLCLNNNIQNVLWGKSLSLQYCVLTRDL